MHVWTRLKPSSVGKTGIGLYPDGMVEHDELVGELLKKIDDLGLRDNTIVIYSTDNGAEVGTWPDGGMTPFHGEKGITWEGGFRVPCLVRWPGVIQPGTIYNNIMSQEDCNRSKNRNKICGIHPAKARTWTSPRSAWRKQDGKEGKP